MPQVSYRALPASFTVEDFAGTLRPAMITSSENRQQPCRRGRVRRSATARLCTAALLLGTALLAHAATATEHDAGAWLIVSGNQPFRPGGAESRWRFAFDAQHRFVNDAAGFRQHLIRPSIGYTLDNGVQLWAGYGRFENEPSNRPASFENRYWQQANWQVGRYRGGTLGARVRIEERLLSTGDDVAVVARLMLRYARPFGDSAGPYWAVGLEPFIDFRDTDWGARRGVSQNRLTVGVGRSLGDSLSLELGYMNWAFFPRSGPDRSIHLATANLRVKF
ncbi:MAG: DUF2490 domain-containing protein [Pseudomonadota bacterium]